MGPTTLLRREIKRVFVPHLASKSFLPDLRHAPNFLAYRKIEADQVHVCEIQWDKYGRPRFALNFGKAPADGVVDLLGKPVAPRRRLPFWRSDIGTARPKSRPVDVRMVPAGSPLDRVPHVMVPAPPS